MRAVDRTFALLPFADRLPADVVAPRQLSLGKFGRSNFLTYQMGGARLAVQGLGHGIGCRLSLMSSVRKTCRALKSGPLRMGT